MSLAIKMGHRRWRQIEDGYESKGGPRSQAGDMQLAHMANVVGVPPERLAEVGRDAAAAILLEMKRQALEPIPEEPAKQYPEWVGEDELCRYIWDGPGPEAARQMAIFAVQAYRQSTAASVRDRRRESDNG